ncbi:heavy-metal-associated domain-containing protein [Salarchaeum sp. JOR-1]|uniref:heavy-metal-associated domain-containing protein n=1 Tax=Salarchaeum sp. JOR-1 TaxID=2599399 RepID=UPI001198C70C|nr:cation transporter [Salarchaeum sp. JOR-1]QDX39568.1 heavy metal transporter [Salarchaeum sp. JOR-1]
MPTTLSVSDLTCDGCEEIVHDALADVSGVESVDISREENEAVVEGDADHDRLLRAVDYAGYEGDIQE